MARYVGMGLIVMMGIVLTGSNAQEKFLGRTAESWLAQLKEIDAKSRRSAAYALGKMGRSVGPGVGEMLTALAKEKDPKVRDALVFALGEIAREVKTNDALEPAFVKALKDSDPYVRRSAAYALGCLARKSKATRDALDVALGDEAFLVRQNAVWALVQFSDAALDSFGRALRDPHPSVQREAANALLHCPDGDKVHDLLKDLLPLCKDTHPETCRAAVSVLVKIVDSGDKHAILFLREALKHRDPEIRRNAALALTNIGGPDTLVALDVLLETAKNADLELRRQAVLGIRNIGPSASAAVDDLVKILNDDPDAKMREHAALALGGIGKASESAVPHLVAKIKDLAEDRDVRKECAMALARIGPVPTAVKHVPDLLAVLVNPREEQTVRERIIWALRPHAAGLRSIKGPLEAFTQILKEPKTIDNKMLRYDSAYMLGMIWQREAPEATLDVLSEFLGDPTVKVYIKTDSGVTGGGAEIAIGKSKLEERGEGDGRANACDALLMMGPIRYGNRQDILRQLRVIAQDPKAYPPLRKKAIELLK